MEGKIRKVIGAKQFGFIMSDGIEYFFHRDDFHGHWEDLWKDFDNGAVNPINVSFRKVDSPKGPRATEVRRLDHPNQAA